MRTKRKAIVLISMASIILGALAAGCSFAPSSATKTAADKAGAAGAASPETFNDTPSADGKAGAASSETFNDTPSADDTENAADAETPQENAEGRWHVLAPEVAAEVDADFEGTVWHIAEGAFSIAETKVAILDDGSLASSSPSSTADIPDSELIHVVVDEDTYFYIRTISGNGESYEDTEAGFGDLKEHMSVQMKGSFENDVFYAAEVRMVKVS